jgi:hypothetical protein
MGIELTREYLKCIRTRYGLAKKNEKTKILDEFCKVTGRNRKYSIRLLNSLPKIKKSGGRKKTYCGRCRFHLGKLWIKMNQMCSKKMVIALPEWLPFYIHPDCDTETRRLLLTMSASTIDRELKQYKAKYLRGRRAGTKPGSILKTIIPIKPFDYNVTKPGFVEADTVAHCGNSLQGQFAWSLTFTDIYSGWTNNRATWGKGQVGVVDSIKDIEADLPYELYAFNSDNGSEFLNHHLIQYFSSDERQKQKVRFSRSRAYKKNDNCHVEQKNWTHVRELFGYERFEKKDIISIMNNIYKNYHNPLLNFFVPQVKLLHKTRVGSKYVRKYSKPMTPYQRLLECPEVKEEIKEVLKSIKEKLNPFELRELIEANLKLIAFHLKQEENKNEAA